MPLHPIQNQPQKSFHQQGTDWFDDAHDSVLILESRDFEENGRSPLTEISYRA
jgi:hypothetical protein